MARLAGSPLLVVGVTLAIAGVVTGILMGITHMDSVAIVSTLATIWGLDLALVIYLLTAKDTDKLLAHIDALQDQLSAALEGPGPDAVVVEGTPQIESTSGASAQKVSQSEETPTGVPEDFQSNRSPESALPSPSLETEVQRPLYSEVPVQHVPYTEIPGQQGPSTKTPVHRGPSAETPGQHGPSTTIPAQPGPSPEVPTQPGPTPKAHPHPSHTHGTAPVPLVPITQPVPQPATESLPVTEYMPKEYVEALREQLRMQAEDIVRAWTPNPHGNGPWVVEDAKGDRWSVFQGRRNQPTVISLESRERLRQIRDEKQEVRQRLHDENQELHRRIRDEEQQRVHARQDARSGRTRNRKNR